MCVDILYTVKEAKLLLLLLTVIHSLLFFYWNPAVKWRSHCAVLNVGSWDGKRLLGLLSYVRAMIMIDCLL